ncbi:MAG: hypothetical protein A2451_11455, partial [Bdellovibrionales bacterium RIFOXYC2_FULL_39_8]
MAIKLDNDNQDGIMADINMTPLIDIMLVLLIIFMVTSSISLESGLDIDLPKTKVKTSAKDGNAVIVSLSVNGTISVQGKAATMESLGDTIKEALANEKSDVVVFEGDKTSQLGMAIQIMDIAKEAGAEKFAIAAV